MKATIQREVSLPKLPSASGIEVVGDLAYIIGDDAPFLYCLSARDMVAGNPVQLFETAHFSSGRIPKDLKPDLECLTAVALPDGQKGLLVMGSGATTAREVGFWVTLGAGTPPAATVYPLSLTPLYNALKPLLPKGIALNLEAAAATADTLFLMQRSVGTDAGNLVFRCSLGAAMDFVQHRTAQVPRIEVQRYALPHINGKPSGLSGASVHKNLLFVSASVEDTTDPVADGEVLGSFVGIIDPKQQSRNAVPTRMAQLVQPNGKPYLGKVESITVRRELARGRYELLLVTDDDKGGSTAVEVELTT
ncbi:DUF6929 family protein [Solirubrum puertoriconensis]|uniref:Uncharacterized protein n=1 Tax=Solirubrum puertoriconensis TaxID=1751427 RepID=A0A9X0HPJ1_SOLP1|nr:hypothetical protein [Solirubrum puertoriconensis]KUG09751.1 hypothetical protein ASU33_18895 [Solirubrum puertoriconensis]